ncbi:MAG: cyclic nucleotide-binding domain-containing protein [Actinomycetota bacterium]
MPEQGQTGRWPTVLVAGALIGVVEAVFAVAFASLVFGGRIVSYQAEGIGLYLGAAFLTLAILAWRAGKRGVVGGLQGAVAAILSIVVAKSALRGSLETGFLTVVAATVVVTVLCGVTFLVLGVRRRSDLIRYIPVPVVGGLIAGAGWLLLQGGIHMAIGEPLFYTDLEDLFEGGALRLWLPTVAFGFVLLLAVRIVKKPLTIPVTIGIGLAGFALVVLAMGASMDDVREGGWLMGPFYGDMFWNTWSALALTNADWVSVARSWAVITVAVIVAALVLLNSLGRTEVVLDQDLDTDQELRDAGLLNLVSGALGGMPGYHARNLTSLAAGMNVDAQRAGLVAAAVPLATLLFGATVLELIPRMIVGGMLVFLGLSFIAEWVWERRRSLPRIEYVVVLVILAVVVARGYLPGFVVGLVLAVGLLALTYARVDLVHEVTFGDVYRSSVDRPPDERERLPALADKVQILRVSGHLFFGSANRLLERIRARVDSQTPPRFVVIDLGRVTGVDASAVATLAKAERLASAQGTQIVLTGASEGVRTRLERGGVLGTQGVVSFETDLDSGLLRCEEALLEPAAPEGDGVTGPDGFPPGLAPHFERVPLAEGTVLLHQDEPPGDIYVLAEGRLAVEISTPEGKRLRLRTLRPGAVVGEIALYTGVPRTADVVAETRCVVLRCSREQIARMEAEDPDAAADLHRWLAGTIAYRLGDTMRTLDVLLD